MNQLAVCLVLVLTLGVAYGLKCYECEGEAVFNNAGDCGDDFEGEKDELKMCNATAGEVWCRKEKTGANKVYTQVERGCAVQCEDQNIAYVNRVVCCNNEDGCNGVGSVVASMAVVVSTVLAAVWV